MKKSSILFLIFIFLIPAMRAQKLKGLYSNLAPFQEHYKFYRFGNNGTFEYHSGASLGDDIYGKGDFEVLGDTLILKYNTTEPKKLGYHTTEIWENQKTSIKFDFQVVDLENKPIPNVNVIYLNNSGYEKIILNEQGEGTGIFKKRQDSVKINFSFLGYERYTAKFDLNFSKNIKVYLAEWTSGIPILDQVDTLEIVEFEMDTLKLKDKEGNIDKWIRR